MKIAMALYLDKVVVVIVAEHAETGQILSIRGTQLKRLESQ